MIEKQNKIISREEMYDGWLPSNIKTKFSLISEKFDVFSVAEDDIGNPYLFWVSINREKGWVEIVARATPQLILDILYNKKTLYDATTECVKKGPAYMIIFAGTKKIINEIACLEDDFFPVKGEYLDTEEDEFLEEKKYYHKKSNESFNIIFLDVDGVLNNEKYILKTHDSTALDPESIRLIRKLASKTNSKIVLSSSWRYIKVDVKYLEDELEIEFFDLTSFDRTITRGENIRQWLRIHQKNVKNYVIIDDEDDDIKDSRHFVQTKFKIGFKEKDYQKAFDILNGKIEKEDNSTTIFSFHKNK